MNNEQVLRKIRSVKLCLMAHPDNTEDSEFADRISDMEEIEEQLSKQSPPISSGQQGGDMTARDFFDSPESAITLDLICNPTEKEFLLDMIELYAKGKVLQSLPTSPSSVK